MTPNPKVLEDRPYSFSEVFKLNIPAADLLPALGYGLTRKFLEFPGTQPIDVSSLEQEFREVLPYTDLNRVEAGISPAPPTPPDMRPRIRRFTNVEQDQTDE